MKCNCVFFKKLLQQTLNFQIEIMRRRSRSVMLVGCSWNIEYNCVAARMCNTVIEIMTVQLRRHFNTTVLAVIKFKLCLTQLVKLSINLRLANITENCLRQFWIFFLFFCFFLFLKF